jgi:hypothetical protein
VNRVSLFGMKPRPNPEVAVIGTLRGRKKSIKTNTKDQIKRSFHEMKGTIKEEAGKVNVMVESDNGQRLLGLRLGVFYTVAV